MSVLLFLLWLIIAIGIPALGVWIASSLAAYRHGPVWLVVTSGLLLFPILPMLWDAHAERRRRKKGTSGPRSLTAWDRVVFRTIALNLVFLSALLVKFPAATFAALETRGDWFLEGRSGERVEALRAQLFRVAGGLEWLYRAAHKNPYEKDLVATPRPGVTPEPVPETARARPEPSPAAPAAEPEPVARIGGDGTLAWPLPNEIHPLVASLSEDVETSVSSVARYIAERESDPFQRIKALHDYVADRVVYDVEALRAGKHGAQDADSVFHRRTAVCAGYANLLAALGRAAGEEIVVIGGDARTFGSDLTGEGHAWNAVHIGGRWTLIDSTWDAGYIHEDDGRFVKSYTTDYLFVPPAVHGVSHFPDDAEWQLREPRLSRGDFFRQPMLKARFFAEGLELVAPTRSQVEARGSVDVSLRNPRHDTVLAAVQERKGGADERCEVRVSGEDTVVACRLPRAGTFRVELYAGPSGLETFPKVGEIEVQNR